MAVLELKDLSYTYKGKNNKQILHDINATFERGRFYVIIGVSGAGKSTLSSLLAGLDVPQTGVIQYEGKDIQAIGLSNYRKHHVSIVFQNYNLIDYMTPLENIRLVKKDADDDILPQLGLDEAEAKRNVMKLSGGQQQRTALGRALISDAAIILADEPTGNLDHETTEDIIKILRDSAERLHKCVIVVTHSKQVALAADVIYRLKKGHLTMISE